MFDQVLASALPEGADGTSVVLHAHMARGTARAMLRDLQVVQQAHHIPNPNVNQAQVIVWLLAHYILNPNPCLGVEHCGPTTKQKLPG